MNEIILSVLIASGIAILAGLILSIASIIMQVPKNEKVEKILKILPGANCGACGFAGCDGYALSLAQGKSQPGLCSPGGNEVTLKIAAVLGTDAKKADPKKAFIMCNGNCNVTSKKAEYIGISSCTAANQMHAGSKLCPYGCIGFGDCIASCKYDAISISDGIAHVDMNKCVGCSQCVKTCPKGIIKMIPAHSQAIVNCSNNDKGVITKKACEVGCLGCKLCEKACEHDAIHINDTLAHIDSTKCVGCGKCRDVCPNGCISIIKYN